MKKEDDELKSRRDFFKRAAKASLPILGALVMTNIPLISKAANSSRRCATCSGSCQGGCEGCYGSCKGTCSGRCTGSCRGTCMNQCKGEGENVLQLGPRYR